MMYKDFINEWNNASDFVAAHTSGSTGKPKAISLLKADMRVSADNTISYFALGRSSRLLCPLSFDYIAGKMMVVRAIQSGARLDVVTPSNRFEYDGKTVYDLVCVVPPQIDYLLDNPQWSSLLRNVLIGGAPLDGRRRESLIECGYNAFESYGMTETCSHVAVRRITENSFEAMRNITFESDVRGCLTISLPEYSVKKIVTNDVVRLIDNRHFVWLGRYDNVIISGGKKIHPEILERKIVEAVPEAADAIFYIAAGNDEKWGRVPVLVLEGDNHQAELLLEKIRTVLPHDQAPARYMTSDALERTSSGKLKRIKLVD